MVRGKDARLAEHVRESRAAVGRDPGQLVVDQRTNERLGAVRSGPEFRRDRVGAQPGRDDVHRALATQPVRDLDQAQLRLEVQAVPRHGFDRGHAVGQHLVEPPPSMRKQLALRCRPRRRDRREDPAAGVEDVEVRRAPLAQDELAFARPGEDQVRVRIDQAGGHRAPAGVDAREARHRIPLGLESGFDRGAGPDGQDPPFPARDHRRIWPGRIRRHKTRDVGLPGSAPHAAGHRDDLRRTDDEEARRRFARPSALDDAERSAGHGRDRFPDARAASRRSSRACDGEKSRRRR